MADPFIAEVHIFAGNFAPRGYALCDGQLLAVATNDALFSLVGTLYGGDGRTTFGLPDLRGRVPIHAGSGVGLSPRSLASRGGAESVTLTPAQVSHTHTAQASTAPASESRPGGNVPGGDTSIDLYAEPPVPTASMAPAAVSSAGGSQSHTNLQPYLCVNFIIALVGVYPSRP